MKESTRKRKQNFILNAASKVIATKGMTNFTMEEVAEEGNVTKVTLYSYFQSKENLLMAVIYDVTDTISQNLQGAIIAAGKLSGSRTLLVILESCIDSITKDPIFGCLISEYLPLYHQPASQLSTALAESEYLEKVKKDLDSLLNHFHNAVRQGQSDKTIVNDVPSKTLAVAIFNDFLGFASTAHISEILADENGATLEILKNLHLKKVKAMISK